MFDEIKGRFGATAQDILTILINRTCYLDSVIPCAETKDAIEFLRLAIQVKVRSKQRSSGELRILVTGHIYQLADSRRQVIRFIRRSGGAITYPTEWPGIQSQELLRALIAHAQYHATLWGKNETSLFIGYIREVLFLYEVRAYRRKMEKANRTNTVHDDGERHRMWRENPYSDVPFNKERIELRPIGDDGHILRHR